MPQHDLNLLAGWALVLAAFVSGAGVGLGFHKPQFLGGYDSLRRRMVRLGHIAFAALGMINVLYGLTPFPIAGTGAAGVASLGLIVGGVAMPAVCFLTAWREPFRHLFFIPVASLVLAVGAILYGGLTS
jgi:hypothetical protein